MGRHGERLGQVSTARDSATHPPSVWAISSFHTPIYSGAAIVVQRVYRRLAEDGFRCTVLTARYCQAAGRPRRECIDGVEVRRLRLLPLCRTGIGRIDAALGTLRYVLFNLACLWTMLCNRRRIDVLQVQSGFLPLLVPGARLLGVPAVVRLSMLRAAAPAAAGRGPANLENWALGRADRVVSLSQTMARQYGLNPARTVVIPQGVDTTLFRPASDEERRQLREQLGLDPAAFYVLLAGSMIHRKGVDLLVKAFVQVAPHCPQLRLVLIGQCDFTDHPLQESRDQLNQYRAGLVSELNRHALEDRALWTGKLEPESVAPYMRAADTLCLPSRLEGSPSTVLEAMACGLPVVVSDLQGTAAELFTHGREGYIVEGEDDGAYARYLESLATDPDLARRMGELGRKRIEEAFSFAQAVARYRELLLSLASRRRGRSE